MNWPTDTEVHLREMLATARAALAEMERERDALLVRRDELLALAAKLTRDVPYEEEARSAATLIAEVGTLRAQLAEERALHAKLSADAHETARRVTSSLAAQIKQLTTARDVLLAEVAENYSIAITARAMMNDEATEADLRAIADEVLNSPAAERVALLPKRLRDYGDLGIKAAPVQVDDPARCAVCGWPLAHQPDGGCVRGNCSERPRPERLYAAERAAKERP